MWAVPVARRNGGGFKSNRHHVSWEPVFLKQISLLVRLSNTAAEVRLLHQGLFPAHAHAHLHTLHTFRCTARKRGGVEQCTQQAREVGAEEGAKLLH